MAHLYPDACKHYHGSVSGGVAPQKVPRSPKCGVYPQDAADDAPESHVLLFSSDLALDAETMIDYYALGFQIEFNFRDAKQYWGLEDFMNVKKTPVNNAANLSMFMVNVSAKLLAPLRLEHAELRVLDLKARYRGKPKYLRETLKILPQKPKPIVIDQIAERLGSIGAIHHTPSQLNTS